MNGSNRAYVKACFASLVTIQMVGLALVAIPFTVKGNPSGVGEAVEIIAQCFLFGGMVTFVPTLLYSLLLGLLAEWSENFFWPPAMLYVFSGMLTVATYFISRHIWLSRLASRTAVGGPDLLLLLAALLAGSAGAFVATQVIRRHEAV